MRGAVFLGNRKIEISNFPDPTPGSGEVVIEMKASGMCGSDLKFYRSPPGAAQAALGLGGNAGPSSAGTSPAAWSRRAARAFRNARHRSASESWITTTRAAACASIAGSVGRSFAKPDHRLWRDRERRPCRISEGARSYAGSAARGAELHRGGRGVVRHRHSIWRAAPHASGGRLDPRRVRTGPRWP